MWFKNIKLFQLPVEFKIDDADLEEKLNQFEFKPCGSATPQSIGWTPVIDQEGAPLVHGAMGFKMICMKIEEKVLPATVVREYTDDRVKEVEALDDRKLSKREKASIKDQMYFTLIQQAFCRSSKIYAYFDVTQNWLIVNCANSKKLELFVTHLKKALPAIELITPETCNIPKLMTRWLLTEEYPDSFMVEKNAVLEDFNDVKRVIRVKNQDLFNESIQDFLKDGCVPKQINLTWFDRITFNLNHDMTLTGLKYDDAVVEAGDDGETETAADRFDADFLIMTGALQQMLKEVLEQVAPIDDDKAEAA